MAFTYPIFRSFIQAGFECSTHRLRTGKRLDLLASTAHDRLARDDYRRIEQYGIRTVRVGARWHLIERSTGRYDFDSLAPILDAAAETDTEVVLDLLHFGWPDDVDIFATSFVRRFAQFTRALARFLQSSTPLRFFAPVNEVSFISWAGGDIGRMNPCTVGRGAELKRNLIRAAIASSEILLAEIPGVRLISPEPVIHIVGDPTIAGDELEAEMYRRAQFEVWDMLSGALAPELGGNRKYLDIIGANFYDRNEWVHNSKSLTRDDPRYRPLRWILHEVWDRYRRPIFISETGTENDARAEWFHYVCEEVFATLQLGIPVHGICLYPIVNHPGWDDDRHCHNGLFDYADAYGNREAHRPLADAVIYQQERFARSRFIAYDSHQHRPDLLFPSAMGFCLPTPPAPDEPLCT